MVKKAVILLCTAASAAGCTLLVDAEGTAEKLKCGPKYGCPRGQVCSKDGWCLYVPEIGQDAEYHTDSAPDSSSLEDGFERDQDLDESLDLVQDPDWPEPGETDYKEVHCNEGTADCNQDPGDGCEVDLKNDVNNCGKCGRRCKPRDNAAAVCLDGECTYICLNGFADVDKDLEDEAGNGCECKNKRLDPDDSVCCDGPGGKPVCYVAGNKAGPMISIPESRFWMGCRDDLNGDFTCFDRETPQHEVELSGFWIQVHEVTQREYAVFLNASERRPPECNSSYHWSPETDPFKPVACISWQDARDYCNWIGGDLPTEAQWEFSARGRMSYAGDYEVFPFGGSNLSCEDANYQGCKGAAADVGSFKDISPFGVMDLAGNVREWTRDWYSKDYYSNSPSRDPTGPDSGSERVVRGGSWNFSVEEMRSASRKWSAGPAHDLGFRCVYSP